MTYNPKIYGKLLSDVLPASIDSDEEYERIDKIFNELFNKKSLSPEEDRLFALLADLLEDYGRKVTGEISTLDFELYPGNITTPGTDVGYVVTEYGVAELFGKSERDRSVSLINIAHYKNVLRH